MSRLTPHPDCPECAQGKHVNCTHEVLATEKGLLRWLAVQEEANEWQRTHPDWRRGQALFNALRLMDPPLAEQIRGTDLDPFHNDSPERLQRFAQAVMTCGVEALVDHGDYWVTCGCRNRNHQDPPQ